MATTTFVVLEFVGDPYPPIGTRQHFTDYDEAVRYAINAHYNLENEMFVYAGHHRGEQPPRRRPLAQTCACPQGGEPVHLFRKGCGYPELRAT